MDIKETLRVLSHMAGPSGFEAPVAEKAAELLRPLTDEAWVDRFGSAVGLRRCGKPGAPKVLLDAHLDEIGLMVIGREEGYLLCRSIGSVDPRVLPNRELTILTDPPLFGVVAALPPHLHAEGEGSKAIALAELYVDVGLSEEEAAARIPIGTPVVFRSELTELGGRLLSGKAMDDRACFIILLRTLELLREEELGVDLLVLGSTREEVSAAGAKTALFALEPDCCVAVDVTHGKTPDAQPAKDKVFELGGGPVVGVGPSMTRWMSERLLRKAKEGEIPHQVEIMAGHNGTNAWHMQTIREGIATTVLSLPLKYMHSPFETLQPEDIEQTARLLAAFVRGIETEGGLRPC